ncbi:MAG: hypothetical protein ACFFDF_12875 [Candidatus Odinarchaeota archaeon]
MSIQNSECVNTLSIHQNKHQNKEWLYQEYVLNKRTMEAIAKECNVSTTTIEWWIWKFNFPIFQYHKRKHIKKGFGTNIRHRDVVEKYIQRKLNPNEIVHHINLNPFDNRIENLWIAPNRLSHRNAHASLRKISKKIISELIKEGTISFNKKEGNYRYEERKMDSA